MLYFTVPLFGQVPLVMNYHSYLGGLTGTGQILYCLVAVRSLMGGVARFGSGKIAMRMRKCGA